MKINLRQEDSASVLDIQGSVDAHNFDVLKAGLSKLLRNGKNRIVLNLESAGELPNEVIRELAILDVFARELSGKLVLVSSHAELKQKVQAFAKPPVVAILPNVAKAVEYLKDLGSLEGEDASDNFDVVKAQLEEKTRMVSALEAQLKQSDPGAMQKLRHENAELADKVRLLEGQLGEILGGARKQPVDAEGFLEKFEALEESVRKLSGEKQAGAAK